MGYERAQRIQDWIAEWGSELPTPQPGSYLWDIEELPTVLESKR
jgi:hypothetical protein